MKSAGEIMEILEAFDLTGSFRAAGELSGCSHHTVAGHVAAREAGGGWDPLGVRPLLIDGFLPKLEEWMEHSHGKIRADKAHEKLLALGYAGSERTTRRAVAHVRQQRRATLHAAYDANPRRFRHRRPEPPKLPAAAWINQPSREALIQSN